jgi:hypothetical protein
MMPTLMRGKVRNRQDYASTLLKSIDQSTKSTTHVSLFHLLSLAAIGMSIALFLSGRRMEAIFIGLWPPTFEALKAAAERR